MKELGSRSVLCCALPSHAVLRRAVLCHALPSCDQLCCDILCLSHAMPWCACAVLCCAMPWCACAVLCHGVPHAVLCHGVPVLGRIMLCHAVLFRAVPRCTVLSHVIVML